MGPTTIAEFYRAEAARCRDRAEKAKTPERATRWRHVAEDCLRVAAELEAAERPCISRRRHHQSGIKLSFHPQGLSRVGGGKALDPASRAALKCRPSSTSTLKPRFAPGLFLSGNLRRPGCFSLCYLLRHISVDCQVCVLSFTHRLRHVLRQPVILDSFVEALRNAQQHET